MHAQMEEGRDGTLACAGGHSLSGNDFSVAGISGVGRNVAAFQHAHTLPSALHVVATDRTNERLIATALESILNDRRF